MSLIDRPQANPTAPNLGESEPVGERRLRDESSMQVALAQAQEATKCGEVPVGAAVYHQGVLIAQAHNAPIALCDPTAHAEVLALREAAKVLGNYRLQECSLYVTLEPCAMCAGAIFNARVREVIYAAKDEKSGVAGSVLDLFGDARVNHHTQVRGGVLQEQSVQLLQEFFKSQRRANRQEAASLKSFLREDAIRKTPHDLGGVRSAHAESHFYALKSVAGMRLHYRQSMAKEASQPKPQTYLCLHGANTSSSFFEPLLNSLLTPTLMPVSSGAIRILVPDLLGHGASDRFKKSQSYSFSLAMNALLEWVQAMDLQAFTVITHDTALVWGLMLKALMPERVVSLVGLNPCWRSEIHAPLALVSKGESSLRSSSLMGQLSQAEPSAVVLYRFIDHWLQKGSRVGDLKSHLLRLAPHLSDTELSELSCGFQQAFERTVFEAFHRLYPSLEAAFADFDLEVRDLHRHFDQDFLQKSRLMHTQPFSISVQPLPVDLVGSIVSSFAVHEALKGTEFLSQASMSRLGQVLREERL